MKCIKKWFSHELGLKIISLILAVILWFYISGDITGEHVKIEMRLFKDVPVEIMGSLENFGTSLRLHPEKVNLKLAGPPEILNDLNSMDLKAYIEVKNLSLGKYLLPLMVVLPEKTTLVSEKPIIEVEIGVSENIKGG